MKLNTAVSEIERIGDIGREAQFSVNVKNSVMYQLLSQMIYTDPVLAIIRELSCNAYDAHVDANNSDTPFDIHLPNKIEPFFSVKDYGVGLSDEDVFEIYTTYGESTKLKSNNTIGALGLGSKSPFAIVSAYEVISRFNGKRIVYAMYKNEENIPTCAQVSINSTDEPNGLEVKVPVGPDSKYYDDFRPKINAAMQYFPVQPRVLGDAEFKFADPYKNAGYSGDGWLFKSGDSYNHNITALQAFVPYRVNASKITDSLSSAARLLASIGDIVVTIPNGQLQFAASREEIRYEEETIELIVNEIEKVAQRIYNTFRKEAQAYQSNMYLRLRNQIKMCKQVFGSYNNGTAFIRQFADNDDRTFYELLKQYIFAEPKLIKGVIEHHHIQQLKVRPARHRAGAVALQSVSKVPSEPFSLRDKTLFVYDDYERRGGTSALINYLKHIPSAREERYQNVILISHNNVPHEAELEDISKMFGHPIIVPLSTLPKYVKEKKMTRYVSNMIYKMTGHTSAYSNPLGWDGISGFEDDGDDKLYVELNRKRIVINGDVNTSFKKNHLRTMIKVINATMGTAYSISDLHGVSCRHVHKVAKQDNWVDLYDLLTDCLIENEEYFFDQSLAVRAKEAIDIDYIKAMLEFDHLESQIESLPDNSIFKREVGAVVSILQRHNYDGGGDFDGIDFSDLRYTTNDIRTFFAEIEDQAENSQKWHTMDREKIDDVYPLLDRVSYYHGNDTILSQMIDYILMVDNNS